MACSIRNSIEYGYVRVFTCVVILAMGMVQPIAAAALPSSVVLPGSPKCDANNRDPCSTFPDLCSTGGGLCVLKGPCEYECVCPPDGRRGRDCTGREDPPRPQGEEVNETPNRGSLLNSLLVFPQDLFWDLNHVLRPEESVKMMLSTPPPVIDTSLGTTTTSSPNWSSKPNESTLLTTLISTVRQNLEASINMSVSATLPSVTPSYAASTPEKQHEQTQHDQSISTTRLPYASTTPVRRDDSTDVSLYWSSPPLVNSATSDSPLLPNSLTKDAAFDRISGTVNIPSDDYSTTIPSSNVRNGGVTEKNSITSSMSLDDRRPRSSTAKVPETTINPFTQIAPLFDKTASPSMPTAYTTASNPISTPLTTLTVEVSTTDISSVNFSPLTDNVSTQKSTRVSDNDVSITTSAPTTNPTNTMFSNNHGIITKESLVSTESLPSTGPTRSREQFPGHGGFPTFFSDVFQDPNRGKETDNAAMNKRVHRVFYPRPQFEFTRFERRRS